MTQTEPRACLEFGRLFAQPDLCSRGDLAVVECVLAFADRQAAFCKPLRTGKSLRTKPSDAASMVCIGTISSENRDLHRFGENAFCRSRPLDDRGPAACDAAWRLAVMASGCRVSYLKNILPPQQMRAGMKPGCAYAELSARASGSRPDGRFNNGCRRIRASSDYAHPIYISSFSRVSHVALDDIELYSL